MSSQKKRVRAVASTPPPETRHRKKTRLQFQDEKNARSVPTTQQALILKAIRQPYEVITDQPTPDVQYEDEILVRVEAIGLNPIDWKAPDYNFGIPVLPYIAGRELAGTVVKATSSADSRIKEGDTVLVPSTDYRDLRKAAYQQYSISATFNAIRLPQSISKSSGSILGVAFVSAALALGICMGLNFDKVEHGPDLLSIVRKIDPRRLPSDIQNECLQGISASERAREGDYLVIWGGSATCAHAAKQLARLAGLKIISVTDSAKHGLRLSSNDAIRADLVVDSHNPDRAIEVIKATTRGHARFGLDMQGKDTAVHLLHSLQTPAATDSAELKDVNPTEHSRTLPSPPSTPLEKLVASQKSHLVGMTGLPKSNIPDGIVLHNVPIKLFHEIPEVGEALSAWCERLLAKGRLQPPDVIGLVDGLSGINGGLDRMRRREISGGRLVAVLEEH